MPKCVVILQPLIVGQASSIVWWLGQGSGETVKGGSQSSRNKTEDSTYERRKVGQLSLGVT